MPTRSRSLAASSWSDEGLNRGGRDARTIDVKVDGEEGGLRVIEPMKVAGRGRIEGKGGTRRVSGVGARGGKGLLKRDGAANAIP